MKNVDELFIDSVEKFIIDKFWKSGIVAITYKSSAFIYVKIRDFHILKNDIIKTSDEVIKECGRLYWVFTVSGVKFYFNLESDGMLEFFY